MRNWALALGLVVFVGCAADAGEDVAPVDEAEVAAVACESVTATVAEHLRAGRVTQVVTFVFIFPVTNYYVANTGTSQPLGTDANRRVTLYRQRWGGYTLDAESCASFCGDGVIDVREQCEGTPTATCADGGFTGGGTVTCDASCHNDFSACRTATCGNGAVEIGEDCDGASLGRYGSCSDVPGKYFSGGSLACDATCHYDLSACTTQCGNGVIDGDEECDGAARAPQFTNARCQDFESPRPAFPFFNRLRYVGGTVTCHPVTCRLDTSQCKEASGCYWTPSNTPTVYCM